MIKNIMAVALGLLLIALTYAWWQAYGPAKALLISNFDECVRAGNPVLETYPAQCRTPQGRIFISPRELQQFGN